jgi:L-aminopeptidase/D-esterase-like protein
MGTASVSRGDLVVAALFAVNAFGSVVDDDGNVIVGPTPAPEEDQGEPPQDSLFGTNTTIGVVATNARLSKERAHLLAMAGHLGIERAIRPAHTIWDGDTVFSLATGETDATQAELEELAELAVAEAIRRAVRAGDPSLGGEDG